MSVTFSIRGSQCNWDTGEGFVNVSNSNARVILETLGIPCEDDIYGEVRGEDLRKKCAMGLKALFQNGDPGTDTVVEKEPGKATVIMCGRSEGYMIERLHQLMCLAKQAGDIGVVTWG